jgi:hypothetical protein
MGCEKGGSGVGSAVVKDGRKSKADKRIGSNFVSTMLR